MKIVCVTMAKLSKQFKQILVTSLLLHQTAGLVAQVSRPPASKHHSSSQRLKDFFQLVNQANAVFVYPKGFREIAAPDDEDFNFDYALELPGRGFEIWYSVTPQKENWFNYTRTQTNKGAGMANPDSAYSVDGRAMALQLSGNQPYYEHRIPDEVLARYHADAGKSFFISLVDLPDTRHYKYALLITLQKYHIGTIMAICFCNDKGPQFFKDINRASHSMMFKP